MFKGQITTPDKKLFSQEWFLCYTVTLVNNILDHVMARESILQMVLPMIQMKHLWRNISTAGF